MKFVGKRSLACLLAAGLLVSLGNYATAGGKGKDIVSTAVEAGQFKTLATALTKAGLVETLKGKGPFTVFAPTDAAFAKLPKHVIADLLKPENKEALVGILTYHVAPGNLTSGVLTKRSGLVTVNGQQLDLKVKNGSLFVDKSKVVKADIGCSNGVIHVIDTVMLPSADDIVATAVKANNFKTLVTAVKAAGLVEALKSKGPLTVFAPTDAAFAKLPKSTLESLLQPENKEKLVAILKYHVVPGRNYASDVVKMRGLKTLQGASIQVNRTADGVRLNDSGLVATDIDTSNGVIHVIDTVLLPPQKAASRPANPCRDVIVQAVNKGAPLYNAGHPQQCTNVYRHAIHELMQMSTDIMPHAARQRLQHAMSQLPHHHDPRAQAWLLRGAMDDVYGMMSTIE